MVERLHLQVKGAEVVEKCGRLTVGGKGELLIVFAIALGYADREAPENQFKTSRAVQKEILQWYE